MHDKVRYKDICGPDIKVVLSKIKWRYALMPFMFCAFEKRLDIPVAAAWSTSIRWPNGRCGVNLSYATSESHTGLGLAKLLTCASYLALEEEVGLDTMGVVNIQCDSNNEAAIRVAQSMGLAAAPNNDFEVPELGLRYLGFVQDGAGFYRYAQDVCSQRLASALELTKSIGPKPDIIEVSLCG